jgi:pilus assembly protein Flp/PilA
VEIKMLKMYVRCMTILNSLKENKKGQGLVEYGMIIGLIALVVIGVMATLGDQIKAFFTSITGTLATHVPTTPTP